MFAPRGSSSPLPAAEAAVNRYAGLKSSQWLGEVQVETTLTQTKVFTEGPTVDTSGHVYFTNVPNSDDSQILKWDPQRKQLSVFREKSNGANGLLIDAHGRLLACEGGHNDQGRLTRTDLATGEITVLAESYNGKPWGAPNDLILDDRGRIYFTSRLAKPVEGGNVNAVYRLDPDGKLERIIASPDIDMPNGVETSIDGKHLYLIDSHPQEDHARCVRVFDLNADGAATNGRILYNFYPGRSGDGLTIDAEGNLYVAAGLHKRRGTSETLETRPGIHVISPKGQLLAFAETPTDTITNCTFGDHDRRTLYITCGRQLLSCRTRVAGRPTFKG